MPHLFIARTTDRLGWLSELPDHWSVTVHDVRGDLDGARLPRDVALLRGGSGSAAAYLNFMATARITDPFDLTVFCPQDPLAHSPDFFDLLQVPHLWGDVQPLSSLGSREHDAPPPNLLTHDTRDHIGDLAVRAERFGLFTCQPLPYADPTAQRQAQVYRHQNGLPEGSNLVAHFLAKCGLRELAQQAASADVGLLAHGDLFAVRNRRLQSLQRRCGSQLARLAERVNASPATGPADDARMLGLVWLHLLGEPFVRFETTARPEEQSEPTGKAMARVVASIDAVLAQSVVGHMGRGTVAPEAITQGIEALRQRAIVAAAAGQPDEAQRLLQQALLRQPGHVALLSQAASLAWQAGDLISAIRHAREALRIDVRTSASAYVLGMALARRNDRAEALPWLRAVAADDSHQRFRGERPDLAEAASRELTRLNMLPGALTAAADAARDSSATA